MDKELEKRIDDSEIDYLKKIEDIRCFPCLVPGSRLTNEDAKVIWEAYQQCCLETEKLIKIDYGTTKK